MKMNQKGFGAIEAVLVIIIIGLLGGAGFYIYNSQQNTKDSLDSTTRSGSTPQKIEKTENTSEESNLATYENSTLGFSFTYPKSWVKVLDAKDDTFSTNVQLNSPDLKLIPDHAFGVSEAGGIFRVQVAKTEDKDTQTAKANNPYSVKPYDVKIAGVDAVREDKCGHPIQDSTCVYFVRNGLYYSLSYRRSDKETSVTAKYKAEFEALLASFKFN